ncbi:PaaI family thioesterase [Kutzneria sp. CA-103260]|uniref:PaaI family thioesterase n=1 Tax=Kutzneria sp. CA-103260 TaxID=2802641 RepID=UPI001BA8F048|nr:PaaI family thioesterase [Kutzneria sp. CA-103260]QUQ67209.1 PaaI family thioesterase [Kutzneria sp. CA-103260]
MIDNRLDEERGTVTRERTHEWADPREQAKAAHGMDGLEFMRFLVREGGIPMGSTLGFRVTKADPGRVVITCEVGEHLYNPIGSVHGGVAASLLDSVAGSAVHTTLPAGTAYSSLDLTVHYLRPITAETGLVRAIGTVLNRGRRTALAQAELRDPADRLLAHATSSCMLFPVDAP